MTTPSPVVRSGFAAPTTAFDAAAATALVTQFCLSYDVHRHTRYAVVPNLEHALQTASQVGPDARWRRMARWSGNSDVDGVPETVLLRDERDVLYNRFVAGMPEAAWLPPNTVVSVSRWARFAPTMRVAEQLGLGWILPIRREVLLVPLPVTRYADGVPHCDTNRPAIEWADGSGAFYLHGIEFDEPLYRAVIGGELSVRRIAALRDAEQRPIAMRYLTFDEAERAGATPVGTDLYRLPLPPRLAGDRRFGRRTALHFRRVADSQSIHWTEAQLD